MTKKEWNDIVDADVIVYDEIVARIVELVPPKFQSDVINDLKNMFDLGFAEGQKYVWFQRSGFGEATAEEADLNYTMTSIGIDGQTVVKQYEVQSDGTIVETE